MKPAVVRYREKNKDKYNEYMRNYNAKRTRENAEKREEQKLLEFMKKKYGDDIIDKINFMNIMDNFYNKK